MDDVTLTTTTTLEAPWAKQGRRDAQQVMAFFIELRECGAEDVVAQAIATSYAGGVCGSRVAEAV